MVDILLIVRIVFGVFFILFIPGYALTLALFPKRKQLDDLERIVLSFALSISVVSIVIFYMNSVLKIPINIFSAVLVSIAVTLLGISVWYHKLTKKERNDFYKFIRKHFRK